MRPYLRIFYITKNFNLSKYTNSELKRESMHCVSSYAPLEHF